MTPPSVFCWGGAAIGGTVDGAADVGGPQPAAGAAVLAAGAGAPSVGVLGVVRPGVDTVGSGALSEA